MTSLDSRIGMDSSLGADIARQLERLADRPERRAAFVNGLILDGTARRLGILSGLQGFMKLPPDEARTRTRARMAELICTRVSAFGQVTRDDLLGGGFTDDEIAALYPEALRASGVQRMAA